MDLENLRARRLRAHRLSDPAPDVVSAARHLTATPAQEFWGGRWALAVRTAGEPTLREVDRAFDRGDLIRSWTQRGTVHIVDPRDLGWMLSVTSARQDRQAAGIHRSLEIDDHPLGRAERAARAALCGGNRLTRLEFAEVLVGAGVDTSGMRGNMILTALCRRGVIVLGPVVPREGAPTREQYLVAADEWIRDAATPVDPLAELLVRYLRAHGPAGLADFRWWAGLPLGLARAAREGAGERGSEIEEGIFVQAGTAGGSGVGAGAAASFDGLEVPALALGPFDEYYLSYADRTTICTPAQAAAIGPSANGAVKPVLIGSGGEVIGTWKHSLAVGRHHLDPVAELAPGGPGEASVAAALDRFARFLRG